MAVRMASLKRSSSGSWSTRKAVPKDVKELYGLGEAKKTWPASLTETEVRPLFAEWLRQVEQKITDLRASKAPQKTTSNPQATAVPQAIPRGLNRSEQIALRATWYSWLLERFWDQPDDTPESWEPALELSLPSDLDALPDCRGRFAWTVFSGLDTIIAEFVDDQRLNLTSASHAEFMWQAVDAYRDFASDVIAHLNCNESQASSVALQRPSEPTPSPADSNAPLTHTTPLKDILRAYINERQPAASSAKKFTANIEHLIEFIGHDNASHITKQDIQNWKDYLLNERDLKANTVREGYLAAANVVFNYGKENDLIAFNPVADVKVRGPKVLKLRDKGLTTEEGSLILQNTLKFSDPKPRTFDAVRRWAPWLCAYTGARINEITQLRSEDIQIKEGVHIIHITPEAGSVKTGEARDVPIHDHLIAQGFLEFANAACGHLFYDPANARGGTAAHPQSKKAGERLAKWVRELGVTDTGVSPNHGWRHRFKTQARIFNMDTVASDVITGHSTGTEGANYGTWPPPRLKREIDKLPFIDVS